MDRTGVSGGGMNKVELSEISEAWIYYKKCVGMMKQFPYNLMFQGMTARAYVRVLTLQAQYQYK
jgi:hypothetical protein